MAKFAGIVGAGLQAGAAAALPILAAREENRLQMMRDAALQRFQGEQNRLQRQSNERVATLYAGRYGSGGGASVDDIRQLANSIFEASEFSETPLTYNQAYEQAQMMLQAQGTDPDLGQFDAALRGGAAGEAGTTPTTTGTAPRLAAPPGAPSSEPPGRSGTPPPASPVALAAPADTAAERNRARGDMANPRPPLTERGSLRHLLPDWVPPQGSGRAALGRVWDAITSRDTGPDAGEQARAAIEQIKGDTDTMDALRTLFAGAPEDPQAREQYFKQSGLVRDAAQASGMMVDDFLQTLAFSLDLPLPETRQQVAGLVGRAANFVRGVPDRTRMRLEEWGLLSPYHSSGL